jgi:hypothetical protein
MTPYRSSRLHRRILSAITMIVTIAVLGGCVVEAPGDYRVGWWHHHHHDYR